jgi:hypothetical protein
MSDLIWSFSADGKGKYLQYRGTHCGQYVEALNRNGYDAVRTIRGTTHTAYDQTAFFLTAQEAEDWVVEPIALRRLRGT